VTAQRAAPAVRWSRLVGRTKVLVMYMASSTALPFLFYSYPPTPVFSRRPPRPRSAPLPPRPRLAPRGSRPLGRSAEEDPKHLLSLQLLEPLPRFSDSVSYIPICGCAKLSCRSLLGFTQLACRNCGSVKRLCCGRSYFKRRNINFCQSPFMRGSGSFLNLRKEIIGIIKARH
jgi:hypothetical protein